MDREILLPLTLDTQGRIASTGDPSTAARQHLTSYIMTRPGERVMRPTFGTPISDYVFENLDPVEYELVRKRVSDKINRDVRGITLGRITTTTNSDQNTLLLSVEFTLAIGSGQSSTQTTTITLGG